MSAYQWTNGYSYQQIINEKPIMNRGPFYQNSGLGMMKNAKSSPYTIYAVIKSVCIDQFEVDLNNIQLSKRKRVYGQIDYQKH